MLLHLKGIHISKRETKPSEFEKAKTSITSVNIPYKLRYLRTEYFVINPSLYLKASLMRMTVKKKRESNITLTLSLFLMKKFKLTLLTFSIKLNINTL
jgi:hypothetical protein